jgi:hypothetical protein
MKSADDVTSAAPETFGSIVNYAATTTIRRNNCPIAGQYH